MKYFVISLLLLLIYACNFEQSTSNNSHSSIAIIIPDTNLIPKDAFGEAVWYGRSLMLQTAALIGPDGSVGNYTGNKMNCTNCHQDAGTKPFAFNLMRSHQRYPQYRSRENKVLTLADRVNNCIERPHIGKGLPYDSKEMTAFLAYFKWINSFVFKLDSFSGEKALPLIFPDRAANSTQGAKLYNQHCASCHGKDGEGIIALNAKTYTYPPLWGNNAYQAGSSMHRLSIFAAWIKANMPHGSASWFKPVLTDEEALDIAAFVNDDSLHFRKAPLIFDYPNPKTKPFDYGVGPYVDGFSAFQHKFGPFNPILQFHKKGN